LAETALVVGQFGALLGCAVTPAVTLVCLLGGGVSALLWGPLAFLMELALYVVLTRVKDVGRPRA
jgi:integral membrane sensor domain MASE1